MKYKIVDCFINKWRFDIEMTAYKTCARKMLRYVYGLKPWHDTPLNAKPYAVWIVKQLNSCINADGCYAEVGCGLGDIIGNLDFKHRYGFDTSKETVRVARILHPLTKFQQGSFKEVSLGRIDVFIIVNFTSGITTEVLQKQIFELKEKSDVKIFVVDTFLRVNQDYPNLHNWQTVLGKEYVKIQRSKGFDAAGNNRRYIEIWKKID